MTPEATREFVRRFLQLMEARDLDSATAMIAPDARIVFPGGKVFASQQEMVAASRGRYQWIKKSIERVDVCPLAGEETATYVIGTLYGVNTQGVEFSGIRFVDRFVIRGGLIVSQEVWNDLADSGVLEYMP